MDPIPNSPAVPADLAALLGLSATLKETQLQAALLAMVGQELDFLFEASVPEGVKLRLPQGQILVAQGELPYPEGTILRVQVLPPPPGETAPRLQTLAAKLPPTHPLLAPLIQGEAFPLLQRLQAPDPPPPLRALAQLFLHLDSLGPAQSPSESAKPEGLPEVPLPLRESLEKALVQLLPPESPEAMVRRWLNQEAPTARSAPDSRAVPTPSPDLPREESPLPLPLQKALAQIAKSGPLALPPEVREALAEVLAPRLPPRPLADLIVDWAARSKTGGQTLGGIPLPPAPPSKGESPSTPTEAPALTAPREAVLVALAQAPPRVREALQSLIRASVVSPASVPVPTPTAAPAAPGPLIAFLSTLRPPDLQALARGLGLPQNLSAPVLFEAVWASRGRVPSPVELELAGLPEPLAQALSSAWAAEDRDAPPSTRAQTLERTLRSWPETERLGLAHFLIPPAPLIGLPQASPAPPSTPRDLAEAVLRWIQTLEAEAPTIPPGPSAPELPSPRAVVARSLPPELPPEALKLLNHPAIPPGLKETARSWLKALHFLPSRPEPSPAETTPRPVFKDLPLDPATRVGLESRLTGPASDPLAHAEPWGGWVEASLRTLASPLASPREAPFHAIQALDGTAYFEIPLPGRASGPLQIWVEQEGPQESPDAPPVHKVLLGLRFSALGETRVGLLHSTGSLAVRIWAEHPAVLQGSEAALEAELESLGDRVSLRIAALPQGSPTPRSLAVGPGYQGLA